MAVNQGETWEVLAERFHDRHHILNGFSRPDQPIELVTLRAAAISRPALEWSSLPVAAEQGEALIGRREVSDGVVGRTLVAPLSSPRERGRGPGGRRRA